MKNEGKENDCHGHSCSTASVSGIQREQFFFLFQKSLKLRKMTKNMYLRKTMEENYLTCPGMAQCGT